MIIKKNIITKVIIKKYNNEDTLLQAITNAYIYAKLYYTIPSHVDSYEGYADAIFIPYDSDKPVMIVELKYKKNADSGIKQIKKGKYPGMLKPYKDNLLLVSINHDKEYRKGFKHPT